MAYDSGSRISDSEGTAWHYENSTSRKTPAVVTQGNDLLSRFRNGVGNGLAAIPRAVCQGFGSSLGSGRPRLGQLLTQQCSFQAPLPLGTCPSLSLQLILRLSLRLWDLVLFTWTFKVLLDGTQCQCSHLPWIREVPHRGNMTTHWRFFWDQI